MNERPIERLNYYNGQRLEADDFRLEQDYHVRIQRWLMKSLFDPGVADGFQVEPLKDALGKQTKLRVRPGLALDDLGRAIILANQIDLVPQAKFLCVRYFERKDRVQEGQCVVRGASMGTIARSGGPERIVSEAEFVWRRGIPGNDTREIVIAELQLATDCAIEKVLSGARRHAVAAPRITFPYGVVGEKDINKDNPKNIYFHVKHFSAQVFLHLRASQFSTLHYTEIPSHSHGLLVKQDSGEESVGHHHDLNTGGISGHIHSHGTKANVQHLGTGSGGGNHNPDQGSKPGFIVIDNTVDATLTNTNDRDLKDKVKLVVEDSANTPSLTGSTAVESAKHTHDITINTLTKETGAVGIKERSGDQLTFPKSLSITFIGNDVTTNITGAVLSHLQNHGDGSWAAGVVSLGDGTQTHPLVLNGTGAIPLHALVDIGLGENTVILSLEGPENGGCIHYNLYVE